MNAWEKLRQSNTMKVAAATILGAVVAYLTGTVDAAGAAAMAFTGLLQIFQRNRKLNNQPTGPGEFPGVDAGRAGGESS